MNSDEARAARVAGDSRISMADVMDAAAHIYNMASVEIVGPRQTPRMVAIRRVIAHTAHGLGFAGTETAAALGRDHSTLISLRRKPSPTDEIETLTGLARLVTRRRIDDYVDRLVNGEPSR